MKPHKLKPNNCYLHRSAASQPGLTSRCWGRGGGGGLVRVPWRLSDEHGPVELALDVRVARAAGVDKRVDGHQDETLRVEFPHLDG